jgi:hydrogenase maturation protease
MVDDWVSDFAAFLSSKERKTLNLFGIGSPVRRDDSVGLHIVESLRRRVGSSPVPFLKVHAPLVNPELALSRILRGPGRALVFDAVEAQKPPGSVVFATLKQTKFGFFATHNIPLTLLVSLSTDPAEVGLLGIQPEDIEVGEGLSDRVRASAERVVEIVARGIRTAYGISG